MRGLLKSIHGRIFLFLLTFTSLLLIAVGLFLYYEVRELVFESVDRTLHSKAQVISGLLHEENNTVELKIAEVILGEYSIPRSGHYYKVTLNNRLLAASPSLVEPEFSLAPGTPQARNEKLREIVYNSIGPDGERVRVLQKDLTALGSSFRVFVAESLEDSLIMIGSLKRFLFGVIVSAILMVCLTGSWIAKKALDPLSSFSEMISRITHRTLGQRIDAEAETLELKSLSLAFNEMLDRLQKVFESERRLVADASHELKTPVSIIRAQCDVMLQKERTKEEYVSTIKTIREVSLNIDDIVTGLLSLCRLDSGILSPGDFIPLSLKECLEKVLEMVRPLAREKLIRVALDLKEDICVRGDRDGLTEAFLNIAENGIKYNREKGLLAVSAVRDGANALVSIGDTGTGIGEDEKERIFDRFYRSASVRGAEGTGLGLSIARAVIEAHGGRITVESAAGQGSTFTVVLPVAILSVSSSSV